MILLSITIILFILRLVGVNIPVWLVSAPALTAASFSLLLMIKAEFEYWKAIKNTPEETEQ